MKNNRTVTIIVVALNAQKTLPDLLKDIKKQTYPHRLTDIIFVDSASEDKTKHIFQQFNEQNNSFRLIRILDNPKRTLPNGCNIALAKVKTDYVVRLDAHVRIKEDFIKRNVDNLEKGENICCGKVVSAASEDKDLSYILNEAENSMFGGSIADFRRSNEIKYVKTAAFAMYNYKVFKDVGYYNEDLARTEDNDMHYRMRKAGYRFLYDPNIVTTRKTRPSLKKLLKQKYLNGYWVCRTLKVQPGCFSLYHFIPLIFLLSIIWAIILVLFNITNVPIIAIVITYGTATAVMTILSFVRSKNKTVLYAILPLLFLFLHISYGLGSLVGMVSIISWGNK